MNMGTTTYGNSKSKILDCALGVLRGEGLKDWCAEWTAKATHCSHEERGIFLSHGLAAQQKMTWTYVIAEQVAHALTLYDDKHTHEHRYQVFRILQMHFVEEGDKDAFTPVFTHHRPVPVPDLGRTYLAHVNDSCTGLESAPRRKPALRADDQGRGGEGQRPGVAATDGGRKDAAAPAAPATSNTVRSTFIGR